MTFKNFDIIAPANGDVVMCERCGRKKDYLIEVIYLGQKACPSCLTETERLALESEIDN